jgi:hypothetical protein
MLFFCVMLLRILMKKFLVVLLVRKPCCLLFFGSRQIKKTLLVILLRRNENLELQQCYRCILSLQIPSMKNTLLLPVSLPGNENLDNYGAAPFPLLPPANSSKRNSAGPTPPPATFAGRRGGWGSIFWKTREIGLHSYSKICTLWLVPSL